MIPRTPGPLPDTGIMGVGVGSSQLQLDCCVQEGFRQKPLEQLSPERQPESFVQDWLQPKRDGVGVGVSVGVGVGVELGGVGVAVGVPVDVGVPAGVVVRVGVGVFCVQGLS